MTAEEFVKEIFCSKCKNRKYEDICESRKNIKGELQCVNFEPEVKKGKSNE